jgi:hypothetical protein
MIEPIELDDFFISFFSAAMIIVLGACYALFFAFAKILNRKILTMYAYLSYGLLALNVIIFSNVLHLNGYWLIIVGTMLIGYLLAPHGIWHLCVGTHKKIDSASS